mmetsp:Transcript_8662/g.17586  ORF Transcript_8662/g.17586 Transcript_8662/m.17586 type:complete len:80 (+) Transcript_8662:956-1195(+)
MFRGFESLWTCLLQGPARGLYSLSLVVHHLIRSHFQLDVTTTLVFWGLAALGFFSKSLENAPKTVVTVFAVHLGRHGHV